MKKSMGMDICGRAPRSQRGAYFENNVWWWRPLAIYCCEVAPDICSACTHWHTNDWDGLDDADSTALAEILEARINDHSIDSYVLRRVSAINMMPKEQCSTCNGTGIASACSAYFDIFTGQIIQANPGGGPCYRCTGNGFVEPSAARYHFSIENVIAFAAFLKDSGGFSIG